MFHSAEIRWFMEGDVPENTRDWFTANGLAVDETPRVDEYLVLTGSTTTCVKFRQYPGDDRASFEIKTRTSDPVTVDPGGAAPGIMDTWVKWSCRPTDPASFHASITAGEDVWIHVEKCRCVRKYSMDRGAPVEVDPRTERPNEGCQFELTSIRASAATHGAPDWNAAERWWSLSFEAFGSSGDLREYVSLTAELALAGSSLNGLTVERAFSYPAWLTVLVERGGQR